MVKSKCIQLILSLGFGMLVMMQPQKLNAQIADDKCRFLGNIIAGSAPSDFTTYWNQVTPENAGKWGSVESTRDVMNWAPLDLAYNTAKNNGYPFKQHTLIWGQQQPSWIEGILDLDEQRAEVEEWIQLFCERYPDTDYIDVVNEPLHSTPVYSPALGSGWNWVIWAFQKARQYCPNAKLILNDYNIINNNTDTDNYIALINMLKVQNLIDIIGEQGHFLESAENSYLQANLNKLHATGLPIHISEYDVNIADDNAQRDKMMSQFPVLWTHPGMQGITFWGYKQGAIWRPDAYLIRSDNTERPAMTWLKGYVPTVSGGTFCYTTSVNDDSANLSVFPNPATAGKFNVTFKGSPAAITIRDLTGRIVFKAIAQPEPMAIQLNESKGLYILEVKQGGNTRYKKILID